MHGTDFEVVLYAQDYYCINCLPLEIPTDDPEVTPVFALDEVASYPVCCVCKEEHSYMSLTPPVPNERGRWRTLKTTSPSGKTLFQCRCCGRIDIAPNKSCLQSPKCETWTRDRFFEDQIELAHQAIEEMTAEQRQRFLRHIIEFVCMHCGSAGEACTCLEKRV
jgi:hypothetical protein